MDIQDMTDEFYTQLGQHGYRGKIVSAEHFDELHDAIEINRKHHDIAEKIDQAYLTPFHDHIPESVPNVKSLLVIAAPQPQFQVDFHFRGKLCAGLIPSHYMPYTDTHVRSLLEGIFTPQGYRLTKAVLPLKLLAVRSGLACYGKNNIAYVPGMGSFHRLVAFYSDFPCLEESWGEVQALKRCATCAACSHLCPTGAIEPGRFLVRAERCLTLLNELEEDFPEWIDPSWHNCLIGCLLCQRSCPENTHLVSWIEKKVAFSSEETDLLLQGVSLERLPADTVNKLGEIEIIKQRYFTVLPRNLQALFEKQERMQSS